MVLWYGIGALAAVSWIVATIALLKQRIINLNLYDLGWYEGTTIVFWVLALLLCFVTVWQIASHRTQEAMAKQVSAALGTPRSELTPGKYPTVSEPLYLDNQGKNPRFYVFVKEQNKIIAAQTGPNLHIDSTLQGAEHLMVSKSGEKLLVLRHLPPPEPNLPPLLPGNPSSQPTFAR